MTRAAPSRAAANPLAAFLGRDEAFAPGPSPIDSILDAVRAHLGMEIAFASRFVDGRREFTHIRADVPVPAAPGDSEPLEETFCHRILEGRLPQLIRRASDLEATRDIAITAALPVGSHLNVPLRLRDGSLYGTFCCISRTPDLTLTERDLNTLKAFADLAAAQIDREIEENRSHAAASAQIDAVIARRAIVTHFQSIHALADGRPVGVEALSRFPGGDAAQPPDHWFRAAARVGRAVALEMAALEQALAGLAAVPEDLYLSINLSPEALLAGDIAAMFADVPAGRVVVEVTEHCKVADYAPIRDALEPLRGRARIAIDDVGAGYAGLRHIVDLRPDILKLDIGLTRDIDRDPARHALAQAMVAFARSIGSDIVAEGIETQAERDALAALGVAHGQGYHFSRPMPAPDARAFLAAGRSG